MATAIENTPITVDLVALASNTGWSVDGLIATHTSCIEGNIRLTGYPLISGATYEVSYAILVITSGVVVLHAGDSITSAKTVAGAYVQEVTATGTNPIIYFYSNCNCQIQAFNIRNTSNDTSNTQQNTIVNYTKTHKWTDFRTMAPDIGFSIDIDMVTMHYGDLYLHKNGSDDRNNFYGVQYQSIVKGVDAANPSVVKDYETINYQANMLLVSTISGIVSSLGQVTTLIDTDFIKQKLESEGITVISYDKDSIYSASFLNDENEDVVNGASMRGSYLEWELITVNGNLPMILFSVGVESKRVFLGAR